MQLHPSHPSSPSSSLPFPLPHHSLIAAAQQQEQPSSHSHALAAAAGAGVTSALGGGVVEAMSPEAAQAQFNQLLLVRQQIEYYFSAENLSHDKFLRAQMDYQGYVFLDEIAKFRRMMNLNVSPHFMLQAITFSPLLEVLVEEQVAREMGVGGDLYSLPAPVILAGTKLRAAQEVGSSSAPEQPSMPNASLEQHQHQQ